MKKKGLDTLKDVKGTIETCLHPNQIIEKDSNSDIYQKCCGCKQKLWVRKET